jgi:serine/threonine protein phosphatase PrpC
MRNNTSDSGGQGAGRALPKSFSSEIDVDVFGMSNQGYVRGNNEDHFLVVRGGRNLETVFSNLLENPPGNRFEETAYAMIVADGVGGEAAGEVASHEAILGLLNLALRTPDWQFRWGHKERNTVMWRMQDRFRRINAALLEQATAHAALRGMCTTMTAALSHGKDLIIGHVGDSRAYLLRGGKLKRLTRDHTLGERLSAEGMDAETDRLLSELRNVLMQALGANESDWKPDVHDYVLEDGDQLLLCTDGLTGMVDDASIEAILNKNTEAVAACRRLVDVALDKGGRDNITAIVARYRIPGA